MVISLRKLTKASIGDYETRPRHEWVTGHAGQVHRRGVWHSGMGEAAMLSSSNGTHASSAGIDSLESFQCHFNYIRANGLYFCE